MKKTYKIKDIHCPACVMRLESIEDKLEGVKSAKGSYQQSTLEVIFDEAVLDESAIIAEIKRLGYTAADGAN